jgi:serine/threonine-protein kinase HipA
MIKQENLAVFAYIDDAFVPAGLLTLHEENTSVVASEFAYGTKYLTRHQALEVDPVSLSIADKSWVRQKKIFPNAGLKMFGGIRDASPDAWGRRVIEAKLKARANDLPESRYLLEAGSNRIGALDVRTDIQAQQTAGHQSITDLQYLLEAAERIEDGQDIPINLEAIFDAGASLGGARPKASIRDEQGMLWLAKFQSRNERLNVPEIEAATMKLAHICGMTVPDVKLIKVGDRDVMLIRRFDRYWINAEKKYKALAEVVTNQPDGYLSKERRLHFVSGLTMLACDEMASREKNYGDLAQGIRRYCHHSVIRENNRELFARMVYNIFVSNDDDHPRNHGFLWDPYIAGWRLSPLYDVMPRPTQATDRVLFLGVGQDGRSATLDNAISAKEIFNLSLQDAALIIAKVWEKVREWKNYFEEFGASTRSIEQAENAFRHIDHISTSKLRSYLP